jgi:hypothetical protein
MTIPLQAGFEEGLGYVIDTIVNAKAKQKPVIVTITGEPNSGKSELRIQAKKRLEVLGISGWLGNTGDSQDRMGRYFITDPGFVFIEDISFPRFSDQYSREMFGKNPDLRVYVYRNSDDIRHINLKNIAKGVFDLVIENPNAKIKNPYGNRRN